MAYATWLELSEFMLQVNFIIFLLSIELLLNWKNHFFQGVLLSVFAVIGIVANIVFIFIVTTKGEVTPFYRW